MAFPVFLDTNVLYPIGLCDTLLVLAESGTYRPHWSDDVLVELSRNLRRRASLPESAVHHRLREMQRAFPDAEVEGYATMVAGMTCDPKDRHVLAAAARAGAEVIVTFNVRDFPRASLAPYDIRALHPDDFLLDQLDLYPELTLASLATLVSRKRRPPGTLPEFLDYLNVLVPDFVDAFRRRQTSAQDSAHCP